MLLNTIKNIEDLTALTTKPDIKDKNFEFDENYMFALTKGNAQKALECIDGSSRYKSPTYEEYYEKLDKRLENYTLDEWEEIIRLIARSNSTRTPEANIKILAKEIFNDKDNFLQQLKNGDSKVVDDKSYIEGFSRHEKSLASKVCCYLCELEYKISNFVINDNVVRKVLPYYLNCYEIPNDNKNLDKCSYKEITDLIKSLIDKISKNSEKQEKMSYAEIDRIIWYCYRDDPVRREIAIALACEN